MLKKWSVLVGAVGALGLILGGVSLAGASSDIASPTTIETHAFTTQFRFVDLAPNGISQGDEAVFHDVLKDGNGQKQGHDGGTCTVTFASGVGQVQCLVTFVLAGGQITFQGLTTADELNPGGHFSLAVTGGTGTYRNVRGAATVQSVSSSEADVTIQLIP